MAIVRFGRLFPALLILLGLVAAGPARAADPAPAQAPDGVVVFVAGDGAQRSIMMVTPDGGMPTVLADARDGMNTQPAVGPQGQLAWIRRSGADWELVENGRVVSSGSLRLSPAYRPDGTLVAAVSGDNETALYSFKGDTPTLLLSGGRGGLVVSPAFSPEGDRMAYVSNDSDFAQIYVTRLDGGRGTMITSSPVRNTDPAWSPTGEFIAFVTAEKDICLIRPDGQGLRQLTRDQGTNRDPDFSPDGRKIVFSSDRNGRSQLFVMDLDGGDQRPLLPGLSAAQALPVWSAHRPQAPAGR